MSDPKADTEDAKEALQHGERPDRGHTPDALHEALSGTDSGSDTRAGSLKGGSASGSDHDPDQEAINQSLATEGMAQADKSSPDKADAEPIRNTGPSGDHKVKGDDDADADAATG